MTRRKTKISNIDKCVVLWKAYINVKVFKQGLPLIWALVVACCCMLYSSPYIDNSPTIQCQDRMSMDIQQLQCQNIQNLKKFQLQSRYTYNMFKLKTKNW